LDGHRAGYYIHSSQARARPAAVPPCGAGRPRTSRASNRIQPVRPTSILLVVAAAAASVLVAGCSRRPPPTLPAARLDCPPPMLWRAGEPRPQLLRVVNHSADSVAVFTDDCMAGTRVGDLGPGRTRLFALPERLIAYRDGLRLHVVRGAGTPLPEVVVTA